MEIKVRGIYLTIFIISVFFTFMLKGNKIVGSFLIALFGLIGFFVESILDRLEKRNNIDNE